MSTLSAPTAESAIAPLRAAPPCPLCHATASEELLLVERVPVNCSALHRSSEDALTAPTGSLRLVLCAACGYVRNDAFEADALTYDAEYENALDFSPSFRSFLDRLAAELVERHHLEASTIVEIGCGQGSFLAALCAGGRNTGYGFDPAFRRDLELPSTVHVVTELFDPARSTVRADLYCARHALEHIPEPLPFLQMLQPAVAERDATLYIEVPAAEAVFGGESCWDLVYPHVSYFSAPALVGLLGRAGYRVDRVDYRFGNQFLSVEARVEGDLPAPVPAAEIADFVLQARRAATEIERRLESARARVDDAHERGDRVALWGAGAKGVSFLALLDRTIDAVVDINPRKQGSFMPGCGLPIGPPESLALQPPEVVFVLNPMYRDEIAATLADMAIRSEVVVV